MSQWDRLIEQRAWFRKLGLVLFGLGIILSVAQPWIGVQVPVAVVFGLLAMQCFMAYNFSSRLANMQAALDMKQLATRRSEPVPAQGSKIALAPDMTWQTTSGLVIKNTGPHTLWIPPL